MNRSPFRTAAALACAAVLGASAVACGGDDDAEKPATLSSGEFTAQANALCKAAFAEVDEIQDEFGTATTQDEAEGVVTEFIGRIEELVGDLRELAPPASLSGDFDAMLDEVDEVTGQVREKGLDFFTDLTEDPFTAANEKATALGLDDCASTDAGAS